MNHDYNCIAHTVKLTNSWDWPGFSIEAFDEYYARHGFVPAGRATARALAVEKGVEKVVLYMADERVTHAARQLPDGRWTSKMGQLEVIIHNDVSDLIGGEYGRPVRVYVKGKKQRQPHRRAARALTRAARSCYSAVKEEIRWRRKSRGDS
jgi:hypothetical protein